MAEKQQTEPSDKQPGELTDSAPVLPTLLRKGEWPELVGLTPEEAERKIKEDMPRVQIQVVQANCFVTMDFNHGRVQLYLDPSGKVERPPRIG
ncbi:hypothetical protein ES288_A04G116200v1 [Gossypium darwinii]|uniref:Subtilisin inhibitor domain-containing protein n=1 Tax=Gossypium darwinii TaxID=34276 RepID=A0A5D2GWB2_GOSDA|nr:hypothetical protein ES288_A04G116200v1 [Gossypium darwinii]